MHMTKLLTYVKHELKPQFLSWMKQKTENNAKTNVLQHNGKPNQSYWLVPNNNKKEKDDKMSKSNLKMVSTWI